MQFYWAAEHKRIALLSGRKDFKLAREMYLFPLTQIVAAYQLSTARGSNCACVCAEESRKYSDFPADRIEKTAAETSGNNASVNQSSVKKMEYY